MSKYRKRTPKGEKKKSERPGEQGRGGVKNSFSKKGGFGKEGKTHSMQRSWGSCEGEEF